MVSLLLTVLLVHYTSMQCYNQILKVWYYAKPTSYFQVCFAVQKNRLSDNKISYVWILWVLMLLIKCTKIWYVTPSTAKLQSDMSAYSKDAKFHTCLLWILYRIWRAKKWQFLTLRTAKILAWLLLYPKRILQIKFSILTLSSRIQNAKLMLVHRLVE